MFEMAESRRSGSVVSEGDASMTDSGPARTDSERHRDQAAGDTEPRGRENEDPDHHVVRDPDTGHVSEEPTP
jgi:hypothetical protein